jgi:hypothetical protein
VYPGIGGNQRRETTPPRMRCQPRRVADVYAGVPSYEFWREMSYRNKTYVAFASEDILHYRLMQAWQANSNIDFNFFDAHDLNTARDSSLPETIKRRLRERLQNAKQVVLLGTKDAKRKGSDGRSFLAHEVKVIIEYNLPVVVANLDQDRNIDESFIPTPFLDLNYYTLSVSFHAAIIKKALDDWVPGFAAASRTGTHFYKPSVYQSVGL